LERTYSTLTYATLMDYHGGGSGRRTLPATYGSYLPTGLQTQAIKLGYDFQFSVQTLGDYDTEMHVIPDYELIGKFNTYNLAGNANSTPKFALYSGSGNGILKEMWNTDLAPYSQHPTMGSVAPPYKHLQYHSLKADRAKENTIEKDTQSYISANKLTPVVFGYPLFYLPFSCDLSWI